MTNQSTTDRGRVSQINPPKQTSRYLIYLANLFLNLSMKRLFRWKQISPPLKLETLIATFWVPETTKRPRCIMVSENGSLRSWRNVLKLINYSCSSYPTRASYSGQVDGFRNPMKNELKKRPCLKTRVCQTRMQIFLICILIKQQKHVAINIDYFIESATYGFLFTSCKTTE